MPIIRNLGKDFNEGLMDNLRTISYEETGTQSPFVTKDITNPPQERGVLLQGEKRIDDLCNWWGRFYWFPPYRTSC